MCGRTTGLVIRYVEKNQNSKDVNLFLLVICRRIQLVMRGMESGVKSWEERERERDCDRGQEPREGWMKGMEKTWDLRIGSFDSTHTSE